MQSSKAAWACFPKRKNNSTPSDQRWTEENWNTSSTKATIVIQVVSIVIADLLLWVREYSEGLAHLLELLFLLLLHLCSSRAVAICPIMPAKKTFGRNHQNNTNFKKKNIFVLRMPQKQTWVVHQSSFAIGLFDLILRGILGNTEHFVVIFPLALLQLQLCCLQQMLVL